MKNGMAACVALVAVLFSAGCGFTPMYAKKESAAVAANAPQTRYPAIEIANIPDREGHYLRNQLIDRLSAAGAPTAATDGYILKIGAITRSRAGLGVRKDASSTRMQSETFATMQLFDKATGKIVMTRALRSMAGYNRLDNQFANIVSERSQIDNMLNEIADQAMLEIDLFFSRGAQAQP